MRKEYAVDTKFQFSTLHCHSRSELPMICEKMRNTVLTRDVGTLLRAELSRASFPDGTSGTRTTCTICVRSVQATKRCDKSAR